VRVGIDLGGTKVESIALGLDGQVLVRERLSTPQGDYEATLEVIGDLLRSLEKQVGGFDVFGIGTPGAISRRSGLVKNSNSTCLIGKPLVEDLSRLSGKKVYIANDADCFALSEASDGAAEGYDNVFGVILGTGVGGGLVINGKLVRGANDIAGEWGHNPLPWLLSDEFPGPHCYCGKLGCIETFLSGPGLSRDFMEATGERKTAQGIIAAAIEGHHAAILAVDRYEDRLARALAHVINVVDPSAIVLGGGLSNWSRLYSSLPRLLEKYVFSDTVSTVVLPPRFGDSSGVRGAAWLPSMPS
jgi:predicted NBD/HSP70 family sugar kinase